MIVTRKAAKRMIRSVYGQEFRFRITARRTVGVRPVHDTGRTLSWRSLAPGIDSAVEVIDLSLEVQS
jgi:hypothetical protein